MAEYVITSEDLSAIRENVSGMDDAFQEMKALARDLLERCSTLYEERNNLMDGVALMQELLDEKDREIERLKSDRDS